MKVSLIIPMYNAADFLKKCLESAVNQTLLDYEVIVVDDGSLDESVQICKKYCQENSQIRLIQKKHEGLMCTWIRGVQESSADYVAFMDADDWIEPNYLQKMFDAAKDADMVCCNCMREYEDYQVLQREKVQPGRYNKAAIEEQIFPILVNDGEYLERGVTPHRCAKLIRRSIIENNLRWCDKKIIFGEDFNIIFPVVQDCREIVILDDKRGLYHYRQNHKSILRKYKSNLFFQIRQLYTKLLEINKIKGGFDFSCQIQKDSLCLFLEYVKNEANLKKNYGVVSKQILKNYKIMKADFQKISNLSVHLKKTDLLLVFLLERGFRFGLCLWLVVYIMAKYLTGNVDWKYRNEHRKRRLAIRVVMSGPDMSVRGGIRTVAAQYITWEWGGNISFCYIPVYIEKKELYQVAFFLKGCFKIWLLCLLGRVDIVHLHMAERGSFYRKAIIMACVKRCKVKVVLHHHGAEFFDFYDKSHKVKKEWICKVVENADVNLVLGNYQKKEMKKRFPNAICQVMYNTIGCFYDNVYRNDSDLILFVGRLGHRKGVYDLLRVISECDDKLAQNVKLCLCGDGEISRVRKIIKKYDLEKRVVYIGWVSKEQLEKLYCKTMIFILPSYREGLPMSLLEAMSHGIPCMAGRTGATEELLEQGQCGILIEPGNILEIKRELLYLYENPEIRKQIGEKGFRRVREKFELKNGIKELQKIWTKMI